MKHPIRLLVLLSLAWSSPLMARLGETPEQCALRYGLRLNTVSSRAGFWAEEQRYEKKGIQLTIRFIHTPENGVRAGYIEYRPIDTDDQHFSDIVIKGLMETVSTNWTPLEALSIPPPPTNTAASTIKTLARPSKNKVITLEKSSGLEEKRLKKEQDERKALTEAIESRNRAITRIKMLLGKLASTGTQYWQSESAYAVCTDRSLTLISDPYLHTYQQGLLDGTQPLKGF